MAKYFTAFILTLLFFIDASAQPVPTILWRGDTYITLAKDSTLTWSLDTAGLRLFLQTIVDSTVHSDSMIAAIAPITISSKGFTKLIGLHPDTAMAYRSSGTGIDTTKYVSQNRDDHSIRGEKTFAGEVAVVRRFGIGSSALPSPDPTRLYIQHDSASKRLGSTAIGITNVSSTNTWLIHESGIISQPLQSSCRSYRSSSQSLTAGLDSKIYFNAESWDKQYEFDSGTNYEFVARAGGIYLVMATAAIRASDTNYVYLTIYKGSSQHSIGGIYKSTWNGSYHYAACSVTGMVILDAGETLHIRALSNRAALLIGNSEETHLEIVKLL